VTRPAGDERHADLAGEPRPRVGHVHGRGLMAYMDQLDAGAECGVEDRHHVVAGEREDALHAVRCKCRDDRVGASMGCHVVPGVFA
jgi:hypothetical protein